MGDDTINIPASTKAACVVNPGPNFSVTLEEVDVPTPGRGEILIRLSCTGICYSDLHYMLEDLPMVKMRDFGIRSPGHEGVGKIVSLGEGVTDLSVGDRVGLKPAWDSCNQCELCCTDREMYCKKSKQTGLHVTGTYQQYVLGSADHAIKIPDGVKDEIAAPIMCSGATIYRGITEAGLKAGDWVVFSGAGGGVGHMGVQYAKAMGMRVIAVDGGSEKEELCKRIGADHFVDFTKVQDVSAEVVTIADGLGAHGLIVTASNSAAYRGGIGMLRTSGIMMCIGLRKSFS
jgi:alcohol dehydrogenase, propanol-preferring